MNDPALCGVRRGDRIPSASDGFRLIGTGHLSLEGAHRRIKTHARETLLEIGKEAGFGAAIEEDIKAFSSAWPRGTGVIVDINVDLGTILMVARSGDDFMMKGRLVGEAS